MPRDEQLETEREGDAQFERWLLRSASGDPLPTGATQEAWARFASAGAGVALVSGALAEHGVLQRAARRAAVKWAVLGALGGSVLTATFLGTRKPQSDVSMTSAPPAPAVPSSSARADGSRSTPAALEPLARGEGVTPNGVGPQRRLDGARRAAPSRNSKPSNGARSEPSSLAAEVAALDGIQQAVTGRAFLSALRLVEQYHRDFPQGQLSADADALAIEALEALGNQSELAQRATRFLSQYPGDPHAARIGALVEP